MYLSGSHMQLKQTQQNQEPTCLITIGAHKETKSTHFEAILKQAIDEAFNSLGCKQNIYLELEKKYAVHQQAIAENPDKFEAALKNMFGEASLLVELKIMGLLHNKVPQIRYHLRSEEELTLSSYIKNIDKFLF